MLCALNQVCLPNKYFQAFAQLRFVERRLGEDPKIKEQFSTTIHDDLSKHDIVEVENSTCSKTDQLREWYSPHHLIFHTHKPGKIRPVLNGAAMFHRLSLKNALSTGSDWLQNLIHVLIRFGKHPYAVSADIEGKSIQVGVVPKDQLSLQFFAAGGTYN